MTTATPRHYTQSPTIVLPNHWLRAPLAPATSWSALQVQTAREIRAIDFRWQQINLGVPTLLHIAICIQESSLDPSIIGDSGNSYGIHQIYQPAHKDTWQLALSPYADYGYSIMAHQWAAVYSAMGGDAAWANVAGRAAFLQAAAPKMQGSIAWPAGLGAIRYAEAVTLIEKVN